MFQTAELLFALHEMEQQLLKLKDGITEEVKYMRDCKWKSRELGRAHGFSAAASLITERIDKIDKQVGRR